MAVEPAANVRNTTAAALADPELAKAASDFVNAMEKEQGVDPEAILAAPEAGTTGGTAAVEPGGKTVPAAEAQSGTVAEEDVPTSYYGVDMSGLDAESRQKLIAGYTERDNFIQRLQQKRAAEAAAPAEPAPAPAPVAQQPVPTEISDEDLVAALGIDLNDPYGEAQARTAVPLARTLLGLQTEVASLREDRQAEQVVNTWNSTLDELETTYGELPGVDRAGLFEYATERGIGDPASAYWAVAGPAARELQASVAAARAAAATELKQAVAGQTRPRATAGGAPAPIATRNDKGKPVAIRDIFRQAARDASEETGIDWKDAIDSAQIL